MREREIYCCTYRCICWLVLVCVLTRDRTCNLGIWDDSNQLSYPARVLCYPWLSAPHSQAPGLALGAPLCIATEGLAFPLPAPHQAGPKAPPSLLSPLPKQDPCSRAWGHRLQRPSVLFPALSSLNNQILSPHHHDFCSCPNRARRKGSLSGMAGLTGQEGQVSWPGFGVSLEWEVPCARPRPRQLLGQGNRGENTREKPGGLVGPSDKAQDCGGPVSRAPSGSVSSLCLSFPEPFSGTGPPWKGFDVTPRVVLVPGLQ